MIAIVLWFFLGLSGLGFALSLAAHLAALAGVALPGWEHVWGLHFGLFVVWIPTVLVAIRTARFASQREFWTVVLSGCPVWMRRTVFAIFAYAIINFLVFMLGSHPAQRAGADTSFAVIRGFSGHWLIFYSAAFATLYSAIHAPQMFREHKCPAGHVVSPSARFCPQCGYAFHDSPPQA